jgi:very-short-patch-repair endonuclease
MQDHNYRVLRFWNNDVMSNMNGVLEVIATALHEAAPPHPVVEGDDRPLPASGER